MEGLSDWFGMIQDITKDYHSDSIVVSGFCSKVTNAFIGPGVGVAGNPLGELQSHFVASSVISGWMWSIVFLCPFTYVYVPISPKSTEILTYTIRSTDFFLCLSTCYSLRMFGWSASDVQHFVHPHRT